MAYSTTTEMKARVGSNASTTAPGDYEILTNRLGGTTGVDSVATEAIAYADGRINSYIAGAGYAAPIDSDDETVVALLRGFSLDIAVHHLWKNHPSRKTIPDRVQEAYDDAIDWLDQLAKGNVKLPSSVELEESPSAGIGVAHGGWTPQLTEDAMESF